MATADFWVGGETPLLQLHRVAGTPRTHANRIHAKQHAWTKEVLNSCPQRSLLEPRRMGRVHRGGSASSGSWLMCSA